MACKSDEEIEKAKIESQNNLKTLYQQIADLSKEVVPLYDDIGNYFFQEVDYKVLKSAICQWMTVAGRSPESVIDKNLEVPTWIRPWILTEGHCLRASRSTLISSGRERNNERR